MNRSDLSATPFEGSFSNLIEPPTRAHLDAGATRYERANRQLQAKFLLRMKPIYLQRTQSLAALESEVRQASGDQTCPAADASATDAASSAASPCSHTDDILT